MRWINFGSSGLITQPSCVTKSFVKREELAGRERDAEAYVPLLTRAARLMRTNLEGSVRRTRPGPPGSTPLWVYDRTRQPCFRCRTPIERRVLGEQARTNWWCPTCQVD